MTLTHSLGHGARRLACLVLFTLACHSEAVITPNDVEGPVVWGGVDNVTHLKHLWFAGQPDHEALERAKAEGVEAVINLRDPSEHAWDEKSAVESLGMAYFNVPVRGGEPFDSASFARIEALVAEHRDGQILIHCASSNRVGGWLAVHLATTHALSADEALRVGRRAGITHEGIDRAVRDYLSTTQPQ